MPLIALYRYEIKGDRVHKVSKDKRDVSAISEWSYFTMAYNIITTHYHHFLHLHHDCNITTTTTTAIATVNIIAAIF